MDRQLLHRLCMREITSVAMQTIDYNNKPNNYVQPRINLPHAANYLRLLSDSALIELADLLISDVDWDSNILLCNIELCCKH